MGCAAVTWERRLAQGAVFGVHEELGGARGAVAVFFGVFAEATRSACDFSARKLSETTSHKERRKPPPQQVTCDSDGTAPMMGNHNTSWGSEGGQRVPS